MPAFDLVLCLRVIWRRAGLNRRALSKLAEADAFTAHDLNRRDALWAVKGLGGATPLPLFQKQGEGLAECPAGLPLMSLSEQVFEDYVATRLTLREHPIQLLRNQIGRRVQNSNLRNTPDGSWVSVAGLVITRLRPGTASGVIFVTLEDESGTSNIVVWPNAFEEHRKTVMNGRLLKISGKLQREGIVTHVIANQIEDLSQLLDILGDPQAFGQSIEPTRDNPDEARNPIPLKEKPMTDKAKRDPIPKKRPQTVSAYYASGGTRHPREQAKKLFPSRDFH